MGISPSTLRLINEITHCPNVSRCSEPGGKYRPCWEIVRSQGRPDLREYQVPEPWSGHLALAPILFISSNPSISDVEEYPRGDWPEEWLVDFFENRFGGGRKEWVKDGNKCRNKDGSYARATPFWGAVRGRARELLQREPIPGIEYALTEVVHCKCKIRSKSHSKTEQGAHQNGPCRTLDVQLPRQCVFPFQCAACSV